MLMKQLEELKHELPGCIATSIVSVDDGLALASVADDHAGSAGADAFHSNVYHLIRTVLDEVNSEESPESIVIESEHLTFVSSPIANTRYFWHVVTNSKTTLGFTHAVMRKFRADLSRSVTDLLG